MRQTPRYRHPFFWAGFVLLGDGWTTLRLARRAVWDLPALWVLVIVLAVSLGVAWTRRGRRRPISS